MTQVPPCPNTEPISMNDCTSSTPPGHPPRWRALCAVDRRGPGRPGGKSQDHPRRLPDVGQCAAQRLQPEEQPYSADGAGRRRRRRIAGPIAGRRGRDRSARRRPRVPLSPLHVRMAGRRQSRAGRDGRTAIARCADRRRAARSRRPHGTDSRSCRLAAGPGIAQGQRARHLAHARRTRPRRARMLSTNRELEKVRGRIRRGFAHARSPWRARRGAVTAPPAAAGCRRTAACCHPSGRRETCAVATASGPHAFATQQSVDLLRHELEDVRSQLAALRKDLDDLWSNFR